MHKMWSRVSFKFCKHSLWGQIKMATSIHPPLLCLHTIPLPQSERYLHSNRLLQPLVSIATARELDRGDGVWGRVQNHNSEAEDMLAYTSMYWSVWSRLVSSSSFQWSCSDLCMFELYISDDFSIERLWKWKGCRLPPAVHPQAVVSPEHGRHSQLSGHSWRWTGCKKP